MTNISVAIATYNGEKYIKEQLISIIKNLNSDDEIIISDDGSTDSTIDIIKSFKDNRIKIIAGPKKGIIKNFENAIKHCRGDYIFLSDQDDIWMDNKIEKTMNLFNEENYILIVHDNKMVNSQKEIINNSFFEYRGCKNGIINNLIKNSFIGCCMALKKELVSEIIPMPTDIPMHDQWIGLIALLNGKVCFYKEPLILYRRHDSNNSSFKKNNLLKMISNRVHLIKNIIKYKWRKKWKI